MKFMLTMMTLLFTTVSFAQQDDTQLEKKLVIPMVSGVVSVVSGMMVYVEARNPINSKTLYVGTSSKTKAKLLKKGILFDDSYGLTKESADKIRKKVVPMNVGDVLYIQHIHRCKHTSYADDWFGTPHAVTEINNEKELEELYSLVGQENDIKKITYDQASGYIHVPKYGKNKHCYYPHGKAALKKASPIIALYSLVSLVAAGFSVEELISGNHYSKALLNRFHSSGRDSGKDVKQTVASSSSEVNQTKHQ